MPTLSRNQQKAMFAAASGHSNLGIPQSVGREFARADIKRAHGGKIPKKDRTKDAKVLGRPGTMESLRGRAKTSAERTGKGLRASGRRF